MLDYATIIKIRSIYSKNKNVMKYLRKQTTLKINSPEIISYSYDLQAGSYLENLSDPEYKKIWKDIGKKITKIIGEFKPQTILEAGIGEGNTMYHLLSSSSIHSKIYFGFDISLSRILYAQKFLKKYNKKIKLFTSEISNIPIDDNSIDLVYTFHAIEPNHGREEEILKELLRITNRYLILIEPSYELGSKSTKKHIQEHSYCRGLIKILKKMNVKILKHELTGFYKPYNEDAVIIIEKIPKPRKINSKSQSPFISPISGTPLLETRDCFYSNDDCFAFPIINQIPCLIKDQGILVSKLLDKNLQLFRK